VAAPTIRAPVTSPRRCGRLLVCSIDSSGLSLTASARPIIGTQVDLTTTGIPAGSPFGAMLLSLTQACRRRTLTDRHAGCFRQTLNAVSLPFSRRRPPTSSTTDSEPGELIGVHVIAQSFTYSPPLTPLGAIAATAW